MSLILLSQKGMDIIHCRNHGLPSYSGIGIHHLVNVFHKHFFFNIKHLFHHKFFVSDISRTGNNAGSTTDKISMNLYIFLDIPAAVFVALKCYLANTSM